MITDILGINPLIHKERPKCDFNYFLVIIFTFSTFLQSNNSSLRIGPLQLSAVISIFILTVFLIESLAKGKIIYVKHSGQNILFLLFLWSFLSFLISRMFVNEKIFNEIQKFQWLLTLNFYELRGVAFLIRLLLAIFTIEFIITTINSKNKYFLLIKWFIFFYAGVCLLVFFQIILYAVCHIRVGMLYLNESIFRIGGYTGEPSTLAGVLVSGYFLTWILSANNYYDICSKFTTRMLKFLFLVATVDIIFTFSAAWIVGILATLAAIGHKLFKRFHWVIIAFSAVILILFVSPLKRIVLLKTIHETTTVNIRTASWLSGIEMVKEHPVAGVGIGNSPFYSTLFLHKFLPEGTDMGKFYSMRFVPMNTYIGWAAETGIVGLLILFIFIFSLFRMAKKVKYSRYANIVIGGFGGSLFSSAVAINAVPDYLYVGAIIFLLGMYMAGIRLFACGRAAMLQN